MSAAALLAVPLALPAAAQGATDTEPLTGLPWRIVYSVGAYNAGYRIEYYHDRISDAEMTSAATTLCRRAGEAGKVSVRFQQLRDRDGRQWSLGTRYLYVRCQ